MTINTYVVYYTVYIPHPANIMYQMGEIAAISLLIKTRKYLFSPQNFYTTSANFTRSVRRESETDSSKSSLITVSNGRTC